MDNMSSSSIFSKQSQPIDLQQPDLQQPYGSSTERADEDQEDDDIRLDDSDDDVKESERAREMDASFAEISIKGSNSVSAPADVKLEQGNPNKSDQATTEMNLQILDGNWRQFASIWPRWSEEKGVLLL
ncbi:hypothetical protein L1887_21650 [Cichorium endivia]|nr:hypothetical protein L1887_21650 [Cichorium endivia]